MKIKGIDISRAQERFNFAGVEFVIIRAGIRTSEDTYFRRNVSECERLGIPYGLYWYFEAIDDKMYGEELTACLDTIKGTKPRYPVFFDMEEVKQIEKLNNALRTDMAERYARIEARVDEMLATGLLEETKKLLEMGIFEKNPTAAQAIGYKEMLGYVRGEMSLSDARERLIIATRQYAKRQVTWFGAKNYIETVELHPDLPDPTEALISRIREWIDK